ncbi:unnamed protein product [Caenorhabditis angaria]|uniref:Small-subunit processome Utp21 domain-containing protein n=1 Tax=Caenorhabditis angaria TaxID=860376 RepID=A0A9P1N4P7_9PELO|nr:unnamed protein product [Caenorhabditis angaria]
MKRAHSELFSPYRFVGVVTGDVAPSVRTTFVGKKSMLSVLCPIDNVIVQYNGQKLRAVGMSEPLPHKIDAITSSSSCVYASASKEIAILPFCRDITAKIAIPIKTKFMELIGTQLIVIDIENGVRIIDVEKQETVLYLEGSPDFEITSICHPSTYLNKIVLGSAQGKLRILNFRTGKVIHEFEREFGAGICVLRQSTALDIIAIGLENGQVILHNLKSDKILHKFRHDAKITEISFRDDGESSMVTADSNGVLAVWNLEKQELIGKVMNIHTANVNLLHFIPGEPILISASTDNSLRTWIFDGADGMPRELVQLEGHAKPVTSVQFANKHHILSSGMDGSVRKYDVQSLTMRHKLGTAATMSKTQAKKKGVNFENVRLENVVEMAVGWQREAAWDNVVCRHKDSLEITTWTTRNNCAGSVKIEHERFKNDASLIGTIATSICLSPCGNFVFVGYSSGHLDKFNIQSGRFINSFTEKPAKKSTQKGGKKKAEIEKRTAHGSPITSLTIDQRGIELASGCRNGVIRFWNLANNQCIIRLRTPSNLRIEKSVASPANNLIAVACQDENGKSSVTIIDSICHQIVRSFTQIGSKTTSIEFSPDGKWLLIADSDCHIRIFELTTSNLIDVLLFAKPCVGISFNSTGEFLATAHENEQAIYIWANKTMFLAHVNIRALELDYLPSWKDQEEDQVEKSDEEIMENEIIDCDDDDILEEEENRLRNLQLDETLVTYSGLAPSRWANLPDLAMIKERNKPTDAPRKIKQAPFFLTAAPTLEGFEFESQDFGDEPDSESRILQNKRNLLELESSFTKLLRNAKNEADLIDAFESLKAMSLTAIDFQIRSLATTVLATFFRMLLEVLKTKRDFELAQAYLTTAIKIHRTEIWKKSDETNDDELDEVLQLLSEAQNQSWNQYEELMIEDMAVVQWIKNALL